MTSLWPAPLRKPQDPKRRMVSSAGSTALLLIIAMAFVHQPAWARQKNADISRIGQRDVSQRTIISPAKELAIGRQMAGEIDRQFRVIQDPLINAYVGEIAQRIAHNSDLKTPLTVRVIDSPVASTFTLPGGFLYVTAGLILYFDEEGGLAAAFAHEIAHLAARHWAAMMTNAHLLQSARIPAIFYPTDPLFHTYPPPTGGIAIHQQAMPIAFLKFVRKNEAEADYLGVQYLWKAGYDPNAYPAFLARIGKLEEPHPQSEPDPFAVRPRTSERIARSEKEIKTLLPHSGPSLVKTSHLDDVKTRLKAVVTPSRNGGGFRSPEAPTLAPDS